MDEANDLKSHDDFESISSVTYESDEADSIVLDSQKSNDIKVPFLKAKKASTLPTRTVPDFEEKHKLEKSAMESQSSEGSDDVIKSPGIPIIRRNHQRSYSESFYRNKRLSSDTSFDGSEGL